jgi:hypothetical protein
MTAEQVIGALCVGAPFLAITLAMAKMNGWVDTLIVWLITLVTSGLIVVGVWLLFQ